MESTHSKLLRKLANLRVDRSKGVAPHKPLLMIVLLELAKSGQLTDSVLTLTPDLAFRFSVYWSIVAHRRTQPPDVRLPFHHIHSSKLWTPITAGGSESAHRDETVAVKLSEDFFIALSSSEFRQHAGYTLISNFFEPAEQVALYELSGIKPPENTNLLVELGQQADKEAKSKGRTARFRVDVVAAYCHTCALTGYRITTITGHSIVDAAHIHQYARSRNDDPQNGIALCKNAHWLFDLGLWSVDDAYRVLVAEDRFNEACPMQQSLTSMKGKELILPREKLFWPSLDAVRWHRKKFFPNIIDNKVHRGNNQRLA